MTKKARSARFAVTCAMIAALGCRPALAADQSQGMSSSPSTTSSSTTDGSQAQGAAGTNQFGAASTTSSYRQVTAASDMSDDSLGGGMDSTAPTTITNSTAADQGQAASATSAMADDTTTVGMGRSSRLLQSTTPVRRAIYVPSEFEAYVSELVGKPLRRFGAELLVPAARNFSSPPNIAIPADYRVNAGDEIVLGLTGSVQASNLRLVVNTEGQIFVPKVGAIEIAGVPYDQLHTLISGRVARQYRNFNLTVSLGRLRGITVYVTGFVAHPGSYSVSSLSTLVNAVLAAGGPAASGSFRSIQVRRGGKLVTDFDLYDFLLKGDNHGDITLQNGDVVFVAPAGAQLAAIGSVNREAIYEARDKDTLVDVLKYAGGANTVADLGRIHMLDPAANDGWQQLTPEQAAQVAARRGLVVRVLSAVGIAQPEQNLQSLVTVSGEVNKPGRYFVKPGTSLDEVVRMAGGLTTDAYPYGSVFMRESLKREQQENYALAVERMHTTLLVQPLVHSNSLAAGQTDDITGRVAVMRDLINQLSQHHIDGRLVLPIASDATQIPGDFIVKNNDTLYIPSKKMEVGVFGLVNSTSDFKYVPGRRVKDYIRLAGGYARYADSHHVYVERANGTLASGSAALSSRVMPGDLIFVPVNPDYGAFWAHLRDMSGVLLNGLVAAAALKAVQ